MDAVGLAILAVLAIVAVTSLAPRVGVAAPLLLVVLGIAVSFLPFVPAFEVEPELVLAIVLPPLLYSSAVNMPSMDFRRDLPIISGLSVVLVGVSAVLIGLVLVRLIPDIGLPLAIAVGAIVSPTDAVATSIVRKVGVSTRIVTVLEGESLLNDASALVLLRSALAAAAASVSFWAIGGDFLYAVIMAVVIGWVVGRANLRIRSRLELPTASVAISFVAPFVAYVPAEHLGASGLVAAVVAGLITGHGAPRHLSAQDRIMERTVWRTIELLLESAIFLMMGLELYGLVEELHREHEQAGMALTFGAVAASLVLMVRAALVALFVWWMARRQQRAEAGRGRLLEVAEELNSGEAVAAQGLRAIPANGTHHRRGDEERQARRVADRTNRLSRMIDMRLADLDYLASERFSWREGTVLVWAGMRGAVTLAAAQSLPAETTHRALLVLIAFVVAVGTLLIQGSTLPMLVTRLGLNGGDPEQSRAELAALHEELSVVVDAHLADPRLVRPDGQAYSPAVLKLARVEMAAMRPDSEADAQNAISQEEYREVRLEAIRVLREELLRLRDIGNYSSTALTTTLTQLDADQIVLELR
ncbi:MAG: cation:proton antiporter [Candidatus Nanopelagicales bacterium]